MTNLWLSDDEYRQTAGQLWMQQQTQNAHAGVAWAQQAMADALRPAQDAAARLQAMVPQVPTTPSPAPVAPPPVAPPPVEPPLVVPAPAAPAPIGGTPVAAPTPAPGELTATGIAPPVAPTPSTPPVAMPTPAPSMSDVGQTWAQQQIANLLNPSAPTPMPAQPPPSPATAALPDQSQAQGGPALPSSPAPSPGPQPAAPGDLVDQTRQAAIAAGIDPEIFSRQIQQESNFNPSAQSPAGARGIAQFMPETAKGLGINPDDPNQALPGAANLMKSYLSKYGGDWSKALAAYNAGPGNVDQYGGVPPFDETKTYVKNILGGAASAVQNVAQQGLSAVNTAVQGVQSAVARTSQFGLGLSSGDAMAFCGPTAALAFAQTYGRNPTVAEAKQLAQQVGWNPDQGMAGPQSEVQLLKTMGVDAHMTSGVDWAQVGRDASGGNPVIIDTPGHYYYVDGYNQQTGQLHVGTSGTDLKGGSEWMTPDQINGMAQSHGPARAAIFADHPLAQSDGLAQSAAVNPHPLPGRPGGLVTPPGSYNPAPGSLAPDLSGIPAAASQSLQYGRDLIGSILQPDQNVPSSLRSKTDSILQAVQDVGGKSQDLLQQGQNVLQSAQSNISQAPQTVGDILGQNALTSSGIPNIGGKSLLEGLGPGSPLANALGNAITGPSAAGNVTPLQQAGQWLTDKGQDIFSGDQIPGAPGASNVIGGGLQLAGGLLSAPPIDQQSAAQMVMGMAGGGEGLGMQRMYHGTGADFPRVSPEAVSGEGNLFGPGYYLTTSPEVAGGRVSRGQIGINPETGRTSEYDRATGKFTTYMTGAGELQSPGYAQARTTLSAQDMADLLQTVNDEVSGDAGYHGYFQSSTASDIRQLAAGAQQLADTGQMRLAGTPMTGDSAVQYISNRLEAILSRDVPNPETYVKTLRPDIFSTGGNVRAVDVPQNLNLLNIEEPLAPAQAEAIAQQLNTVRPGAWDLSDPEVRHEVASWSQPGADGQSVYDIVRGEVGGPKSAANKLLADAGLDGLTYAGGKRIPMTDASGAPIEHQATVIFPESLDKVRNAISGTLGGAAQTGFAAGLGGAVGLGALAANRDQLPSYLSALGNRAGGLGQDLLANPVAQDVGRNILGPMLGLPNTSVGGLNDVANALNPAVTPQPPLGRAADWLSQQNAPLLSGAAGVAAPMLNQGGALDATYVADALAQKYGTSDSSEYSPEDQQRLAQARTAIGGAVSPLNILQAGRVGALAGGIPTLVHIALNTPVQTALKLANDVPASVLTGHPEASAAELYGAMQGLRSWALTAASTLRAPGPLASSMGGGAGPQALETGLTGAVRLHPVLQDLANQMATHMDLWRSAATSATDAGLARFSPAWRAEVARLIASPTADMTASAKAAGDTAALRGAMGTTGQALTDAVKASPILRFILPIFNVGYHVATQGVERSPLGAAGTAWDVARAAAGQGPYAGPAGFAGRGAAGAVTPLAQRIRNNLIGLGLAYEAYNLASQGLVTGAGPSDPKEQAALRETGWQPDSSLINGRYFDNHLLGPVGWALGQGANLYEATHSPAEGGTLKPIETPQGLRAPGTLDVLGDFVGREGRYFNNETFLSSLGSALNAIGSGVQQGKVVTNELGNVAQSLIPQGALLANAASAVDPYVRQARGSNPVEQFQQQLATRVPGLRESVAARLTATGTPEPNPQQGAGLLLPRSRPVNADPILVSMAQAGVTPSATPTSVPYGPMSEVRLTPQEQQAWEQYRGHVLQQGLSSLVQSPQWQRIPASGQRAALEQVNTLASDAAGKMVLRDIAAGPGAGQSRMLPTGALAPVSGYAPIGLGDPMIQARNQAQHAALMQALLSGQTGLQGLMAANAAAAGAI